MSDEGLSVKSGGAEAELARHARRFDVLIAHAFDLILLVTPAGVVRYRSPAAEPFFGPGPDGGDGATLLDLVHPNDTSSAAAILSVRSPQPPTSGTYQFRLRQRDGAWRFLEARARLLDDGPEAGILVNARDVTDRVRAEEELRTTEARLRQAHKMEAVGRLAGGIAHDFNNVLTAIYGYADLLLDEFDPADARRADIEEIRRSAERAAELTRQLLAFSRQQVLQPKVLDLNQVVTDVHRMLARIVGPGVVTRFEADLRLWPVYADRNQMEQVLINLGANARDAMPGGGSIVIRTANRNVSEAEAERLPGLPPGEYVTLSVTDSGMGMSDDVRRRVFEPFFTTKPLGQGTGLGLATVYGTVKQSGGGIYVESQESTGSTFTIYLPPHASTSAP